MSIKEKDQYYIANTYARFPIEIVSGKGSTVVDSDGKEYIDMGSGIGVTAFGYADEAWQAAITAQLGAVQHTSNLYYTEPCALLAKALCEKTGMKKVFFGNSGAEANECAIKAARKYAESKGKNTTILTLLQSFHGRTVTTLLPLPSFLASFIAAATFVPLEIPHIIPSFDARSFAVFIASSSLIIQISL